MLRVFDGNTTFSTDLRRENSPEFAFVKDYEKALYYENGKMARVLGPGRHKIPSESAPVTLTKALLSFFSIGMITFPPVTREVVYVDTRKKVMSLSGQEMLTLDKVPVRLNLVAQYRVADPEKAVGEAENYLESLYQDMQMASRNYTSAVTLDSLLVNKEKIGDHIVKDVSKKADSMGIELLSAGLKDVVLPGDVREMMTKVFAAEREAKSRLVLAREEAASARALANAAKIISSNEGVLVLKKLDLLREISKNPANKVYFGDDLSFSEVEKKKRK